MRIRRVSEAGRWNRNPARGVSGTTVDRDERTTDMTATKGQAEAMLIKGIGVWCFRRRLLVVGIWLVVMAGGAVAIGPLFAGMGDTTTLTGTETGEAQAVIDGATNHGEQFFAVVDHIDATSARTK